MRLDELEVLALSVGDLDAEQAAHLVSRVTATVKEQRRRMAELQTDVEKLAVREASSAHPVQRALDALAGLGPDQLAQVLDARYLEAVDRLEGERCEAERARIAMLSESNRARFALAQLLGDENLDVSVRARLEAILEQLPR